MLQPERHHKQIPHHCLFCLKMALQPGFRKKLPDPEVPVKQHILHEGLNILTPQQLQAYIGVCDELGLSALVEAHDEAEIQMALDAGARLIGVNNRNLKDFTVDIHNSERLRKCAPEDVLFVAESGIRTAEDIRTLKAAKVNGVLIGETLMRAENKKEMLDQLRGIR